jgi:hypothetical protein
MGNGNEHHSQGTKKTECEIWGYVTWTNGTSYLWVCSHSWWLAISTEAEESPLLEGATKQWPVKTEQTKNITLYCSILSHFSLSLDKFLQSHMQQCVLQNLLKADPLVIQPVASHSTDYATPAPTLKMEATYFSKMLVNFQWTVCCYNPIRQLHSRVCLMFIKHQPAIV